MAAKLQWLQDELQNLKDSGLYNRIRILSSSQGAWLVVDGRRALNFCSNNYLGLANHPRLVAAAQKAMEAYGVDSVTVEVLAYRGGHVRREVVVFRFAIQVTALRP